MKTKLLVVFWIAFFVSCNESDVKPDNYIELITGERRYSFALPVNGIANTYSLDSKHDQLSMILNSEDGIQCQIHILKMDLLGKEYPLIISDKAGPGCAEIQLINMNINVGSVFGETDDVNFLGHTYQGLEMEILNVKDNIILGRLKGPIKTEVGTNDYVETGEFRIKFVIDRLD